MKIMKDANIPTHNKFIRRKEIDNVKSPYFSTNRKALRFTVKRYRVLSYGRVFR